MRFRSKQRLCLRFIVYEEKVNCQLNHPFSTVTAYIAKLKKSNWSVCHRQNLLIRILIKN